MDFSEIKVDLEKLAEKLAGLLSVNDIKNFRELIEHAEYGVALELICTQLCEYEITVSNEVLNLVKKIGLAMSLPEETWTCLEGE